MSPRPARFELTYDVSPEEIDDLGHVNNVVYLKWVQTVATAHWMAAADRQLVADVVWVVLRHEIDYRKPALPGDRVIARTWVGEATGIRFERFVDIVRQGDGTLLASARSVWCPLDRHTGRIRRLDPGLHDQFHEQE